MWTMLQRNAYVILLFNLNFFMTFNCILFLVSCCFMTNLKLYFTLINIHLRRVIFFPTTSCLLAFSLFLPFASKSILSLLCASMNQHIYFNFFKFLAKCLVAVASLSIATTFCFLVCHCFLFCFVFPPSLLLLCHGVHSWVLFE